MGLTTDGGPDDEVPAAVDERAGRAPRGGERAWLVAMTRARLEVG
ncbi:hypothetical protein [Planotetraspora sp. GP83]